MASSIKAPYYRTPWLLNQGVLVANSIKVFRYKKQWLPNRLALVAGEVEILLPKSDFIEISKEDFDRTKTHLDEEEEYVQTKCYSLIGFDGKIELAPKESGEIVDELSLVEIVTHENETVRKMGLLVLQGKSITEAILERKLDI